MQSNEETRRFSSKNCLSCKISGFAVFTGVGAYFLIVERRKAISSKQKNFVTITGTTFAVVIPDGEQYFMQLYATGDTPVGRTMHPYNIFTFKNDSFQSGGVLAYSTYHSTLWKKETLVEINTTTSILEISMQTLDGNDLFPTKIPLQRDRVSDWIYGTDLWMLIGYSGNNDSVIDGISFQHGDNDIISIESIQVNAYNNFSLVNTISEQIGLEQEPLSVKINFPNAFGRGISRITVSFIISQLSLHPNDPVYPPPNRDPTLQSFCDTLNLNCASCGSHPSCIYCVFNESVGFRETRSSCLLNNEDFISRGCLQLGGKIQAVCKIRADEVTDLTTSLSPFSSTTSTQIECIGCDLPIQIEEAAAYPSRKMSRGAVIAISVSACVVVLISIGIIFSVFVFKKFGNNKNSVQMQEISIQKQEPENAGN